MKSILRLAALSFLLLSGSAPGASSDELAVRKVVVEGNEGWLVASRTLDALPLRQWFRDQALVDFSKDIADQKEKQFFIQFDPPQIAFESISIDIDKREASVQTTEIWSASGHDLGSGECFSRNGPNKSRLTYQLKHDGERWKIARTESEPVGDRTPMRPCDAPPPQPK